MINEENISSDIANTDNCLYKGVIKRPNFKSFFKNFTNF